MYVARSIRSSNLISILPFSQLCFTISPLHFFSVGFPAVRIKPPAVGMTIVTIVTSVTCHSRQDCGMLGWGFEAGAMRGMRKEG